MQLYREEIEYRESPRQKSENSSNVNDFQREINTGEIEPEDVASDLPIVTTKIGRIVKQILS